MGKDLKDTLLNMMEASVSLLKTGLDLYSSRSIDMAKLGLLKGAIRRLQKEAQDLPGGT